MNPNSTFRLRNKESSEGLDLVKNNIAQAGLNQQILDMGIMETDLNDIHILETQIKRLQTEFDFVMIDELFYESLVLLAHHLCLPLEYMVGVKYNPPKVRNV